MAEIHRIAKSRLAALLAYGAVVITVAKNTPGDNADGVLFSKLNEFRMFQTGKTDGTGGEHVDALFSAAKNVSLQRSIRGQKTTNT